MSKIDKFISVIKMSIESTKFFVSFLLCLALTLIIFPQFVIGYILGTSFDYHDRKVDADPYYMVGSLLGLLLGFVITTYC